MSIRERLTQLCDVVASEAERNSEFRQRIEQALGAVPQQMDLPAVREGRIRKSKSHDNRPITASVRKSHRRTPAVLDPLALARQGEEVLRKELSRLDIEQLKDAVAQYGMDPGKLVMKWKDTSRIIDRIVELSLARSTKGDAFRADKPSVRQAEGATYVQIYRSNSQKRRSLRAAFSRGSPWGQDRGGHLPENWSLEGEFDLSVPNRALPFLAAEATASIRTNGVFLYQVPSTGLDLQQYRLANQYRLRFTLPIFWNNGGEAPIILGTGTLFRHEERSFLVTADHIFRKDENDPRSPLIDMAQVTVPTEPRMADPRDQNPRTAALITIGKHHIFELNSAVLADIIIIELVDPDVLSVLRSRWSFLPFSQTDDLRDDDDRFVISGFLHQGVRFNRGNVGQAMLNLETDLLHYQPAVKDPASEYDLFFYLQAECATVDGQVRRINSLKGLSGGPIWAVRAVPDNSFWEPSKTMKIVAVQSSELQSKEKWSRGVRWAAARAILSHAGVGLRSPP